MTLLLSVLILVFALHLWEADLRVPFSYWGDALFFGMLTKGLIDGRWCLTNSHLGMPLGQQLHEYPNAESLQLLTLKAISLVAGDYATTLNVFFLLGFPLAALAALYVMRRLGLSSPPAMVGSLLFAFLPFHFRRGMGHLPYSFYWVVPLMVMVALSLFRDVAPAADGSRQPPSLASRRALPVSVGTCALVAASSVYYAFFGAYLMLAAGLCAALWRRTHRCALRPLPLVAVIAVALAADKAPAALYRLQHGPNPEAVVRTVADAEVYGLKIVQLVLPVTGHRLAPLARLKETYNRQSREVNENDTASLGIVATLGFVVLLSRFLLPGGPLAGGSLLGPLAVLNAAALLLATTGGLGALAALCISPLIRGYNRMSVYIAFFAILAVVMLLDRVWRSTRDTPRNRVAATALLGLVLAIGILDQTTGSFAPAYAAVRARWQSDETFVRDVEAALPTRSMIFQLPYVPFPEHPPVHQMEDYDLFRGYLHSRELRWSYGAVKGREADRWQRRVAALPAEALAATLARSGFAGVYVARHGYEDGGRALESELARVLGEPARVSPDGTLAFYRLPPGSAAGEPAAEGRE